MAKRLSWEKLLGMCCLCLSLLSACLLVRLNRESKVSFGEDPDMPLIFIGGVPRSGTTLMRAMLDTHPDIRCGQETHIIPKLVSQMRQMPKQQKVRLEHAGLNDTVLDAATRAFVLEIIAGHGSRAPVLCNKDPFTLTETEYLARLFPNAKFILMLRDGRATVESMISRNIKVGGFNLKDPSQCLQRWNHTMERMFTQCDLVRDRCFLMHYEKLVLNPEVATKELFEFLEIPWNSRVLRHQEFVGSDIELSKLEPTTSQVKKPVYNDSLTKWVGKFSDEVVEKMESLAPLLDVFVVSYLWNVIKKCTSYEVYHARRLNPLTPLFQTMIAGYDSMANPPDYSTLFESHTNISKTYRDWETSLKAFKMFRPQLSQSENVIAAHRHLKMHSLR